MLRTAEDDRGAADDKDTGEETKANIFVEGCRGGGGCVGKGERGDGVGLSSSEARIRRGAPNYSMRVPDQHRNDAMRFCLWTVFSRMMRFAVACRLLRDMQIPLFSLFFVRFWLPPYVYPIFYTQ